MLYIILILLLNLNIVNSIYSWNLDRLNQLYYFPDFNTEYPNENKNIDIYVVDSGISNNKHFYNNIVEKKNFVNSVDYDEIGHGSFVTSIISSKIGILKKNNLHILKIFGSVDSSSENLLYNSLEYIKNECTNNTKKCVVNLSLGFDMIKNDIDDLINSMYKNGILFIVSAGNSNINCKNITPAHLNSVITVGAIDYLNIRSSYSNYGKCVDIYTYGDFIYGLNNKNSTNIMFGTSMSTPIITGYITYFWSVNYDLKNYEVRKLFLDKYSKKINNLNIFIIKTTKYKNIILILSSIFINFIIYNIFYIYLKFK